MRRATSISRTSTTTACVGSPEARGPSVTIAGTGVPGTAGEGGSAASAQVEFPYAVALAPKGLFLVEHDEGLSRVRRIEPAGVGLTYTRAGTGLGSVSIDPPGVMCASSCTNSFASGTVVTLVAAPATTSTFSGWSGDCTGTGTCTVTMSQARTVTATFTGNPQQLTVNLAGTGSGSVSSNPLGISCNPTCSTTFAYDTVVTLTPSVGADSTFTGWSGACAGTGGCSVTMNQARSVTATFTRNPQQLTVSLAGSGTGSVTSNPAGISCSPTCTTTFPFNTVVTLTPAAGVDSFFAGWSGACTGTGGCSVTMSQARTVTAMFTRNPQQLTVNLAGTGTGSVTSNPAGISCSPTCSTAFAYNTVVTLTPSVGADSTFTGWSGACAGTGGCSVTMNQARSVTATYTRNPQQLTVSLAGSGTGSVTSNPAGISCSPTCTTTFPFNTVVTLTPAAGVDSFFAGWSGACTGTGGCSVTMSQARTVTAMFTRNPQQLTVNLAGTGTGSVTSNPAGISCSPTCSTAFAYNTVVTLTPSVGADSTFTGWSGACAGTGGCAVTMSQARTVTATFTRNPQQLTVNLGGTGTGSVTSNPGG